MNITVIGTGYVGLVTGTCLAHAGHNVTCVDSDTAKVRRLQKGEVPIYEPGLSEIFEDVLAHKQLTVTTDLKKGVDTAEVIFLALPTPPSADGSADLSVVLSVATALGPLLKHYMVIVNKSTVPIGTGERVAAQIAANTDISFDVVSNPEFLREGQAVHDFMHPDRIVIGTESDKAKVLMQGLYSSFVETPDQLVWMDIRSAEMTKYAANAFLAMKVSFMNEIANLSEVLGANVDAIRLGIGPDPRIGKSFLFAGVGYGGSCFPKDVQALRHSALKADYDFKLLNDIIEVNTSQKKRLQEKVLAYYKQNINGKRFAVWGLSFKPDTDDIREAPALGLIDALLAAGATVQAYDPEAMHNTAEYFGVRAGLSFADTAYEVLDGADALLVVTEWTQFHTPDFADMKHRMKTPVIFDGRNLYALADMQKAEFYYASVGRPTITQ